MLAKSLLIPGGDFGKLVDYFDWLAYGVVSLSSLGPFG